MRLPRLTGYGMALGAMLLIGCSANMVGTSPAKVKTAGKVSLYDNPHGYGGITMRIIDQRRGYGVQAIEEVEAFDEVQIRLNGSKIPKARFATMSAQPTHVYQSDVLGLLPPGNDYNLIVSLASNSVALNTRMLVGQGAVEAIDVGLGVNREVTVVINTVGEIELFAGNYLVTSGSPEISQAFQPFGFAEVVSNTEVLAGTLFPDDSDMPESQWINRVRLQLTDTNGNILNDPDGTPLASSSMAFDVDVFGEYGENEEFMSSKGAMATFKVPVFQANEKVAYLTLFGLHVKPGTQGQDDQETLIGSKTRGILMLKGSTLSVEVSP